MINIETNDLVLENARFSYLDEHIMVDFKHTKQDIEGTITVGLDPELEDGKHLMTVDTVKPLDNRIEVMAATQSEIISQLSDRTNLAIWIGNAVRPFYRNTKDL